MLIAVKKYIEQREQVTLQQLSLHFNRDPEHLREMLAHWIRKGVIQTMPKPTGCGVRCVACRPEVAEVYRVS